MIIDYAFQLATENTHKWLLLTSILELSIWSHYWSEMPFIYTMIDAFT